MAEKVEALTELVRNLKNVQGSWSYQVLNNVDELVHMLREKLTTEDHKSIQLFLEIGVKHPVRRQLGRVSAAIALAGQIEQPTSQ